MCGLVNIYLCRLVYPALYGVYSNGTVCKACGASDARARESEWNAQGKRGNAAGMRGNAQGKRWDPEESGVILRKWDCWRCTSESVACAGAYRPSRVAGGGRRAAGGGGGPAWRYHVIGITPSRTVTSVVVVQQAEAILLSTVRLPLRSMSSTL